MTRSEYYEALKNLARKKRAQYGFVTPRVLRSDLRRIYRDEGIGIDLWPYKLRHLRGAYVNDDLGPNVMLAKGLPADPMVFTMGHELKHHFVDRELPLSYCDPSNESDAIEIGAEVFAAELIYPEGDFAKDLETLGVVRGKCVPEDIVRLKHDTRTTLSYAGLAKRTEFLGFAPRHSLDRIHWKILEELIYGEPVYKRIRRQRKR